MQQDAIIAYLLHNYKSVLFLYEDSNADKLMQETKEYKIFLLYGIYFKFLYNGNVLYFKFMIVFKWSNIQSNVLVLIVL